MRRSWAGGIALIAVLALGSCGDDWSETPPPVTATPTPTPTPTPSPTPTPTTSPDYEITSDFTRDRSFTAFGAAATLTRHGSGSDWTTTYRASLDAESSAIGFDFIAAARRYRARYNADTIDVATVAQSFPGRSWDEYAEPGDPPPANGRYFGRTDLRAGQTYSGFALWREGNRQPWDRDGATTRILRMLFGARTVAGDLPTTGTTTYTTSVDFSRLQSAEVTIPLIGSAAQPSMSANVTIDWSSRQLSGGITVSPVSGLGSSARPNDTYVIEGSVSATGELSGTLTGVLTGGLDPNLKGKLNGFSGTLIGHVYGPRGVEMGFLYVVAGANSPAGPREEYAGAVLGSQ